MAEEPKQTVRESEYRSLDPYMRECSIRANEPLPPGQYELLKRGKTYSLGITDTLAALFFLGKFEYGHSTWSEDPDTKFVFLHPISKYTYEVDTWNSTLAEKLFTDDALIEGWFEKPPFDFEYETDFTRKTHKTFYFVESELAADGSINILVDASKYKQLKGPPQDISLTPMHTYIANIVEDRRQNYVPPRKKERMYTYAEALDICDHIKQIEQDSKAAKEIKATKGTEAAKVTEARGRRSRAVQQQESKEAQPTKAPSGRKPKKISARVAAVATKSSAAKPRTGTPRKTRT